MTKKYLAIMCSFFMMALSACSTPTEATTQNKQKAHNETLESYKNIESIVGKEALYAALNRYNEITPPPKRLVVVDYTKPSEEERFFVINIVDRVVENKTLVSHAVNSGYRKPYSFSNQPNSKQSSVGLFYTNELYHGKNGLSLRVDGADEGVNDNVRKRFIVIHGSDYAEREFFEQHGMLGRSEGCFAIPMSTHKQILPKIAKQTPMYVHYKK
ncbi:murein L,D-transpeptidase catalytic domain family protein [Vibrio hepatarius]|uniref:murein L,D-transpeptidase catalytic domain family protein n=1 Tax=Vibrio hepatarius TaxID=171383 RepID=UPI001C0825DF|nr:murein L,D-transpeptidase catalytic domain family protein [Vibrio hepatarius]MBU2898294.1 murein L,D-transpeptidase catalytic domain family protein [Vibrio hepatarius]